LLALDGAAEQAKGFPPPVESLCSAPRTAFMLRLCSAGVLIRFKTFARGPALAAASHGWKHPLGVTARLLPSEPSAVARLPCEAAGSAAGADAVSAAYSLAPVFWLLSSQPSRFKAAVGMQRLL